MVFLFVFLLDLSSMFFSPFSSNYSGSLAESYLIWLPTLWFNQCELPPDLIQSWAGLSSTWLCLIIHARQMINLIDQMLFGQEWSPWVLPCFLMWQEFPLNQAQVLCTPLQPLPRAPSAQQTCSVALQLAIPHQRASGRLCSGYAHAFTEPPFMSAPVLHCVSWLLPLFMLAFIHHASWC